MNELEKALAHLKELGATPQELDAYTQEFMAAQGNRPDATRALPRERPNPTGDWEAIPDGIKTAAGIGLSLIPGERVAGAAVQGLARVAPAAGAALGELPVLRNLVRSARAGQRAWQAGKAIEKVVPKAEGYLGNGMGNLAEAAAEAGPLEAMPRRGAALEELIAPAESPVASAVSSPWKPRGRTKAQFEHFADQFANRQATQNAGSTPISDLTENDLLQMTLEHIKQGGSLKSAGDAIRALITR